jgi:hypothetical protein
MLENSAREWLTALAIRSCASSRTIVIISSLTGALLRDRAARAVARCSAA